MQDKELIRFLTELRGSTISILSVCVDKNSIGFEYIEQNARKRTKLYFLNNGIYHAVITSKQGVFPILEKVFTFDRATIVNFETAQNNKRSLVITLIEQNDAMQTIFIDFSEII